MKVKVTQSCSTLCDPHGLYSPWDFPGQNTGVGSFFLLQGIFPTQGLNPGLLHCRQIVLPAEPQPLGILYESLIEFQDIMRITYNSKEKKSPPLKHRQPKENSFLRAQESPNSSHLRWDVCGLSVWNVLSAPPLNSLVELFFQLTFTLQDFRHFTEVGGRSWL